MKKFARYFILLLAGLTMQSTQAAAQVFFVDHFNASPVLSAARTADAWYTDRYAPAAFESALFDGQNRLRQSIGVTEAALARPSSQQGAFYNTQGRKFDINNGSSTSITADLYIGADWGTQHRRADLWATGFNAPDVVSAYPVLGFANTTGSNPTFRAWNESAGIWENLATPVEYGKWCTLRIELSGTVIKYFINGSFVFSYVPDPTLTFGNLMLQAYNFGDPTLTGGQYALESYDVYWDNVGAISGIHNVTQDTYSMTVAASVAAANANDLIQVSPGIYNTGGYVTVDKNGVTIAGVDANGAPIASADGVLATVGPLAGGEANMVFHVTADNVTITGLRIADLNDKAMTINGDNFTLTNCRFENEWDLSGAIYFYDATPGIKSNVNKSVQKSFTITGNVIKGWGVAITDGTGCGWPAATRVIAHNTFGKSTLYPGDTFYAIGFRSVNGTGWCNSPVGGAVITGNIFTDMGTRGYVYFDGSVPAEGLNFADILANNIFPLGASMAFDPAGAPRPLLPSDPFYNAVNKPNQVMLKNAIAAELAKAQDGDLIRTAPGTYNETVTIDKNVAFAPVAFTPQAAPVFALPGLVLRDLIINNTNGFTSPSPMKITGSLTFVKGNLYTSLMTFVDLDVNASISGEKNDATGQSMVIGDVHAARLFDGTTTTANTFGNIGFAVSNVHNNIGAMLILRRTGAGAVVSAGPNSGIMRAWWISGVNPLTSPMTITASWLPNDYNPTAASAILFNSADQAAWSIMSMPAPMASLSVTDATSSYGFFTVGDADAPLPVELTAFTAATAGKKVTLNWSTATEKNNYGFDIERRAAGGAWQQAAFVEGAGTSNTLRSYSYSDAVTAGKYEYRLKQIDRNGAFEYSKTIEATIAFAAEDYTVSQNYPNPFNPTTNIRFAVQSAQHAVVKIYNAIGQEVRTLFNETAQPETMYSLTFDATGLPSGSYYYMLRTADRSEIKRMLLIK